MVVRCECVVVFIDVFRSGKSLHWKFWFMDIVAVFMDFQGLEEIANVIAVSVLKLFVCRKRKNEEKYMLLVSRK